MIEKKEDRLREIGRKMDVGIEGVKRRIKRGGGRGYKSQDAQRNRKQV